MMMMMQQLEPLLDTSILSSDEVQMDDDNFAFVERQAKDDDDDYDDESSYLRLGSPSLLSASSLSSSMDSLASIGSIGSISLADVAKTGWLKKEGGTIRTWKKRFFVLRGSTLMYFKSEQDRSPQGMIDLSKCTAVDVRPPPTPNAKSSAGQAWGFDLVTPQRSFAIEADAERTRMEWVAVLQPIVASFQPSAPKLVGFDANTPSKEGYLEKRGGNDSSKGWKRRFFVLMGPRLYYYADERKGRPLGFADLRECRGLRIVPTTKYPAHGTVFELCTADRTFVFSAETEEVRADWLHSLAERIPQAEAVLSGPASGRSGITANAVKFGELEKRVDNTIEAVWVKRFFVLTKDSNLLIYRSDKDRDPIETIDLGMCTRVLEMVKHSIDRPFTFSMFVQPRQLFLLAAKSSKDLHDWMDWIADAVPEDHTAAAAVADDPTVFHVSEPILAQGYLYKQGEHNKAFRRRWFVLRSDEILYYKRKRDVQEVGVIQLARLGSFASSIKPHLPLETPHGFAVITPDRTYYLGADTDSEREKWIYALQIFLSQRKALQSKRSSSVAEGLFEMSAD